MELKLSDLLVYDDIIVQCHDNPDADAIASGFALYTYLKNHNKKVRFVYCGTGAISKPNLKLMIHELGIESCIEYVPNVDAFLKESHSDIVESDGTMQFCGLVVTVDCQYGAGNVTRIPAIYKAIIDHHRVEIFDVEMAEINSKLGSCSTLLWQMLKNEGEEVTDKTLGTALYYGLYTDTNSLAEISNPLDRDMRDMLVYDKSLIHLFYNSNLSLRELEIAGVAMIRHIYNVQHHYAIIRVDQCDPNILGLISDLLLQVAEVSTCVVFNEWPGGYKYSVRSCIKEARADEIAGFLAEGVGSGGGHKEKAGGFISRALYNGKFPTLHAEAFFSDRMNEYFDECDMIIAKTYDADVSSMPLYVKKNIHLGYVVATDVFPVGTPITIRTLEGDMDIIISEDMIIKIGLKGEVYPNSMDKFLRANEKTDTPYAADPLVPKPEYAPTIRNRSTGEVRDLMPYAYVCIANGGIQIYASCLTKRTKVFTQWDEDMYMYGKPGDFLAIRTDDLHDVYIVEHDIFDKTYDRV